MKVVTLLRLAALLAACATVMDTRADNWNGSVRTKVQIDNRYTHDLHGFGEVWGQFFYDDRARDLHGAVDFVGRSGPQPDGGADGKLYQLFVESGLPSLDARFKLGRFERTDNLGFYRLDGAAAVHAARGSAWTTELYAGRPSRIDHVRSVDGEFVSGVETRVHHAPGWTSTSLPLGVDTLDLRFGYQYFRNSDDSALRARQPLFGQSGGVDTGVIIGDSGVLGGGASNPANIDKHLRPDVHRLFFAGNAAGKLTRLKNSHFDLGLLGTFRADRGRFEDVLLTSQFDLSAKLRLRGSYEYFRPREPFLTFREKFYSAYALGEQTLFRLRAHHSPAARWTYYVGGMGATRDGTDGYGGDIGTSYAVTPNFTLAGEFNYLGLGPEDAKSFYASAAQTVSSVLQIKFNTALRYERKLLYGDNRAVGAEGEIRYLLRNNIVLNVAGSYIFNTRLPDEYLGAVQVIYYFDNFKPKAL